MKKICCLVLLLVFSLTTTIAGAEEFTLRNGIIFGDTMEDILTKETTLVRYSETSNSFRGRIAGIDDAECTFGFDDDGKLESMNYYFGTEINTSRSDVDSNYKTLYESLVRKYGKPIGNTGGDCELITGPAISAMSLYVYLLGSFDGVKSEYIDYDEWIVEVDDYNVKIDLVSYYYRDREYNYTYMLGLSYLKYTDEDYEAERQKMRDEREEVDNDL